MTISLNSYSKLIVLLIISSLHFTCTSQKNSNSAVATPIKNTQSVDIFEHTWKLISINETAVGIDAPKEAHLMVSTSKQVSGNSGCNSFGGTAIMGENGSISFPNLFSTKMACINVNESEFFDALNNVSSYVIQDNKLLLKSKDNKILLTFTRN